jgi:hypothetical protein
VLEYLSGYVVRVHCVFTCGYFVFMTFYHYSAPFPSDCQVESIVELGPCAPLLGL